MCINVTYHAFRTRILFLVGLSGLEPPTSRLSGVRSSLLSYKPILAWCIAVPLTPFGGDEENRTPDPLLARQVLSQLSYTPVWVCYSLVLEVNPQN